MAEKDLIFRLVSSLDDLAKVLFVRGCVFVEEMGVAYAEEFDGSDQSATHVLGLSSNEPFAAARICHIDKSARIDRICVRKAFRGKGLGDRLLSFILSLGEQTGVAEHSILAEGMLVQWYRNHGFTIRKVVKRPDGSECFEMVRTLSKRGVEPAVKSDEKALEAVAISEPTKKRKPAPPASANAICAVSGVPFKITEQDRAFYNKMEVPPPTLCPEERARRRMAFANQRTLFLRECAGSGKRIITNYPPEADIPIYNVLYWLSDKWDKFATGCDFDFSRPFFEQFAELMRVAPRPDLQRAAALDENSDYTNYAGENKNCYLIFDSDKNRDCFHSYSINSCVDVVDCFRVEKCELCYECIDCTNCYDSIFLQNCDNCSSSAFLKSCIGCSNCFGSVNLRNKQYYFMNEELGKKEYEKRFKALRLNQYSKLRKIRPEFAEYGAQFPHKNLQGVQNENVLGDYLTNCKNAFYCFDSRNLWDCKYVIQAFDDAKDCMDCTEVGYGAELFYECCYVGYTARNNRFCTHALGNNSDLTYCYYCPSSSNCFGCVGLHHALYCILNKQYSEQEYKALVPKIIKHMEGTKEWGEFFPPEVSPFPYNLTHAHEYYPLRKAEAIERGYSWRDEEDKEYQPSNYNLPDSIETVRDDVLEAVLACEVTGKNYKIQTPELQFYRKMNLPIPRFCPDERHLARLGLRNGRTLYQRQCAASGKEIVTTIPPDSPIEVLCEEEFFKRLD